MLGVMVGMRVRFRVRVG